MFETTASLGKALMDGLWSLFGIYVPGFSFTFGQMWLGVTLASISILVVRLIFGFGGVPDIAPVPAPRTARAFPRNGGMMNFEKTARGLSDPLPALGHRSGGRGERPRPLDVRQRQR